MSKLWGGRFAGETDAMVRALNDSLPYDRRLMAEDIDGSIVWAYGLVDAGVLTRAEADTLASGLAQVRREWEAGQFTVRDGDEDIHTANERRLTEIVGDVGGKLHTGRSRNDQVATDFRLWVMRATARLDAAVAELQAALIDHAAAHVTTPLPGYTHLQHAQPITWGHWILSYFWPLQRDRGRLAAAYGSADACPLGAAALAGTAFPVDRAALARGLGFTRVAPNSLDAVSDRDFAADFLYAATMLGVHLSRLAEQLIIYSSQEFGFVRLDDAYSTGSSLMPQKKNPDTLELTRGKSGTIAGKLVGLLMTLKGLPSTYDKDLQEDKEGVFAAHDALMLLLPVMRGVIETLQVDAGRMAQQLEAGLLATDLADYLVKRGLPFRQAHHAVGAVVQAAEARGVGLNALSAVELAAIHPLFGADAAAALSVDASLRARAAAGGTAPDQVRRQLAQARAALAENGLTAPALRLEGAADGT